MLVIAMNIQRNNLFEGTDSATLDTINLAASASKFRDLMEAAIVAAYPDADVMVTVTGNFPYISADDGESDCSEIEEHIGDMDGQLFSTEDWVVML